MHNWSRVKSEKLNLLLRKVIDKVLGLPIHTSTERILELGIHNTLEEIAQAQERAQLARLSTTRSGRMILQEQGQHPMAIRRNYNNITDSIRQNIMVCPILRNLHPEHNIGRRVARARTLLRQLSSEEREVVFVTVASYANGKAFVAVVVDGAGRVVNSATVRMKDPIIAEQVVVALALKMDNIEVVYSNSMAALYGASQRGRSQNKR